MEPNESDLSHSSLDRYRFVLPLSSSHEEKDRNEFVPLSPHHNLSFSGTSDDSSGSLDDDYYSSDRPVHARKQASTREFDWNAPYQACLMAPESPQKYHNIVRFISDFMGVASVYGKIIISESNLERKTIQPSQTLNRTSHGGDKYFVQGIVFKFGLDKNISMDPAHPQYLFGGTKDNMERAMKTISNELKGISAYYFCDIPNTFFPLATAIDFHGYRLMAVTKIPIGAGLYHYHPRVNQKLHTNNSTFINSIGLSPTTTLRYGSDDGGVTIHEDPHVYELTKAFGARLNQAPHRIEGARQPFYGPFDLEYHLVENNEEANIYLLDFGRVLPPGIERAVTKNDRFDLFHFLRPNYAKSYPQPLPVDLHTPEDCNKSMAATTQLLHLVQETGNLLTDAKTKSWSASDIVRYMHKKGINVRYIGRLRAAIPLDQVHTRRLLLTEIIARSLKNEIKIVLRDKIKNYSSGTRKSIYTSAIHRFLERVFSWSRQGLKTLLVPAGVSYDEAMLEFATANEIRSLSLSSSHSNENNLTAKFAFVPLETYCEQSDYFYMEVKLLSDFEVCLGVTKGNNNLATFPSLSDTSKRSSAALNMPHYSSGGLIEGKQKKFFVLECATNDIMGIFVHAGQVIFTRNGSIGASFFIYEKNLIPYITLAYGAKVFVNFGDLPFTNDITVFSVKLRERTSFSKLIDYFWSVEIKAIIEERYIMTLTNEERSASLSLMQSIRLPEVIQRFEELSGVRFDPIVAQTASQDDSFFRLLEKHVDITSKSKPLPLFSLFEGISMFYTASEADRDEGVNAKMESLDLAIKKIKRVLLEFGVNTYRYNYIIGSAYFLKFIEESEPLKKDKYLRLSLSYLQRKPPHDENQRWELRVLLQCAIVLIHKFELSQSPDDVTCAKELIAKTLQKKEGEDLVKDELVKISSRITKNKTAQQITSLVGHLEIMNDVFSENNIVSFSCLMLSFEIYWKSIYYIQLDHLKFDQTREDWFINSDYYFEKLVNLMKFLICNDVGKKGILAHFSQKLSSSITGLEICVLLKATAECEALCLFLNPVILNSKNLVILHTNPLTTVTMELFKQNCSSEEVKQKIDEYINCFPKEDIPVGYQKLIEESETQSCTGRFVVGKELSSSSNSSYTMTYSLQKYRLSRIVAVPGGMATCEATDAADQITQEFKITFNAKDVRRIREILAKQEASSLLSFKEECKLCFRLLSILELQYSSQLCSSCWNDWSCSICGKSLTTNEKFGNGRCYQCNTCVRCKSEINFVNTNWRWCNLCYDFMTCLACAKSLTVKEKKDSSNHFFGLCFGCTKCSHCTQVLTRKERESSSGVLILSCDDCWDSLNCIHCAAKLSVEEKEYKYCANCLNNEEAPIHCDYCGGVLKLQEKKYGNEICDKCYDFHYSCKKCSKELTAKEKKRGLQTCTYCSDIK